MSSTLDHPHSVKYMAAPQKQFLISLLCVSLIIADSCAAASGFKVGGFLIYTRFDLNGSPDGKKVLLFEVTRLGDAWLVHSEPALEGAGGINYHEAYEIPSESSVALVTGFTQGDTLAESTLGDLRVRVRTLRHDDLSFINPSVSIPSSIGALLRTSNLAASGSGPGLDGRTGTKRTPIVSEAAVFQGPYPPADWSYAALLRFAFVSPGEITNGLLPQVWDDGHPRRIRFRKAKWTVTADQPSLALNAIFERNGRELRADGTWVSIESARGRGSAEIAARYEVTSTTNVGSFKIPLSFSLTRFASTTSAGEPRVVTTDAGFVLRVAETRSSESIPSKLKSSTVVNDFRAPVNPSVGSPLVYTISQQAIPPLAAVKQSKLLESQKRAMSPSKDMTAPRKIVLAALATLTFLPIVFWYLNCRIKKIKH